MQECERVLGYMRLEDDEEATAAECGCRLEFERNRNDVAVYLCSMHGAAPIMMRELRDGAEFADAVVEVWEKGDLAGAVQILDDWRDDARAALAICDKNVPATPSTRAGLYYCDECGSEDVQEDQWVSYNTGERKSDGPCDDAWCGDCNDHTTISYIDLTEYPPQAEEAGA